MPKALSMTAEQQALALKYMPIAASAAAYYADRHPRLGGEFHGEAKLALCRAAAEYDQAEGVKFSTWAYKKVRWAMADVCRSERVYLESSPFDEDGRGFEVVDDSPGAEAIASAAERAEEFARLVRPFDARTRRFMAAIYVDGRGQGGAGEAAGVSKSRASHMHRDSLDFLRWAYAPRRSESEGLDA